MGGDPCCGSHASCAAYAVSTTCSCCRLSVAKFGRRGEAEERVFWDGLHLLGVVGLMQGAQHMQCLPPAVAVAFRSRSLAAGGEAEERVFWDGLHLLATTSLLGIK